MDQVKQIQAKSRRLLLEETKRIKARQSSLLTRAWGEPVRTHNFIQGQIHPTFRKTLA